MGCEVKLENKSTHEGLEPITERSRIKCCDYQANKYTHPITNILSHAHVLTYHEFCNYLLGMRCIKYGATSIIWTLFLEPCINASVINWSRSSDLVIIRTFLPGSASSDHRCCTTCTMCTRAVTQRVALVNMPDEGDERRKERSQTMNVPSKKRKRKEWQLDNWRCRSYELPHPSSQLPTSLFSWSVL